MRINHNHWRRSLEEGPPHPHPALPWAGPREGCSQLQGVSLWGPARPFRVLEADLESVSSNPFLAPWGKLRLRVAASRSSHPQDWSLRDHTGDSGKGKESKEALPLISQEVCWAPPWGAPGQTGSPAPTLQGKPQKRRSVSRLLPPAQQENRKAEPRGPRSSLTWVGGLSPRSRRDSRVTEKVTLLLKRGGPASSHKEMKFLSSSLCSPTQLKASPSLVTLLERWDHHVLEKGAGTEAQREAPCPKSHRGQGYAELSQEGRPAARLGSDPPPRFPAALNRGEGA